MHTIWIIGGGLFLFALYMWGVDGRWLGAFGVAWLGWTFNSMVAARNQAEQAWSSIDVMLRKRADLVPGLVDTVQRYVEHEEGTLARVTELRAQATAGGLGAERAAEVDDAMSRVLRQLVAVAEAYPELKADEGFQSLQRSLNEVEAQISAARRTYNAAAQQYNDAVRMFPTNAIAAVLGYRERSYFEAGDADQRRPDVMERFRAGARGADEG